MKKISNEIKMMWDVCLVKTILLLANNVLKQGGNSIT